MLFMTQNGLLSNSWKKGDQLSIFGFKVGKLYGQLNSQFPCSTWLGSIPAPGPEVVRQ